MLYFYLLNPVSLRWGAMSSRIDYDLVEPNPATWCQSSAGTCTVFLEQERRRQVSAMQGKAWPWPPHICVLTLVPPCLHRLLPPLARWLNGTCGSSHSSWWPHSFVTRLWSRRCWSHCSTNRCRFQEPTVWAETWL